MAVAADDQHAGLQMTPLRQDDMADALPVIERDALVLRPGAGQGENRSPLLRIARYVVIRDQDNLVLVEKANAEALSRIGSTRRGPPKS